MDVFVDKNENEDGAHRLLLPRTRPPRLVTTTSLLAAVVVVVLLIGGGLQQRRQRTPKQQPPQHPVVVLCKVVISCLCWLGSNLRLRWKLVQFYFKEEETATATITVSGLFIHPVKSLRAIAVPTSTLNCQGLTQDRRCMVVYAVPASSASSSSSSSSRQSSHRFLTQRQCPSLATIAATIRLRRPASMINGEQEELVLEHTTVVSKKSKKETTIQGKTNKTPNNSNNNTQTVCIPLESDAAGAPPSTYYAGIWDDTVLVRDLGDAAAQFLQRIVDRDEELILAASSSTSITSKDETALVGNQRRRVRLVTLATTAGATTAASCYDFDDRSYIPGYAKTWTGGYLGKPTLTDGFPILIASEASLQAVNAQLQDHGKAPIPMSRFRPNIVLKGPQLRPFEEDTWKVIAIGDVVFAIVKACPRCKQACTDQHTGVVDRHYEPVRTLKSIRQNLVGAAAAASSSDQDDGSTTATTSGSDPGNTGGKSSTPSSSSVFFAQNAIPIGRLHGKSIQIGQRVRIIETGPPVYID